MDSTSQFIVPTIIDVPELIVTNEDIDYEENTGLTGGAWFNRLQSIASTLSYAIGPTSIWRFPHLCYKHGGGAFIFAYTLTLIVVGLPLMLMELAFGQYANEGPITIWRLSPAFEGIGYAMCFISAMIAMYYNIINSWTIHYLLASLSFSDLPWSRCDNQWNTASCFLRTQTPNITMVNCTTLANSTANINKTGTSTLKPTSKLILDPSSSAQTLPNSSIFFNNSNCVSPTEGFDNIISTSDEVTLPVDEYFHRNVLELSESITEFVGLNWEALFFLTIIWGITFIVVFKNIRSSGRLSVFTLFMPYLSLFSLLVRAWTLPGSEVGISYYLTPQWYRLQDIDIWADATTQIFFSLSPCWGGIITLASMNKFHNNFHSDAMKLVTINYFTSLFAGLVAFSILGTMSSYSGISISEVVDVGLGFSYMVYSDALSKLPLANINSFIFFATLLHLGFSSQLTVIETVITTIVDTWPNKLRYRKPLILMILCAILFTLSLIMCFKNGFYILQIVDTFAGTHTAMVVGILELVAIAWVYGMENFMQDIDDMISVHRNLFPSRTYWYFMWRYMTPSFLFAILLFCFIDLPPISYRGVEQPHWTTSFGWFLTLICMSIIAAMAIIRFILAPGGSLLDKINYLCRPSEDWAPSSYVSGPKLLNRHVMSENEFDNLGTNYSEQVALNSYRDQDQDSNDSNEDFKVVDGRANYIIPEEEEDTDTGLITNETNV